MSIMESTYFAIMEISSKKFIQRFTFSSKRVYLVKNPFNSNYFLKRHYANSWLEESGLDKEKYAVMEFEHASPGADQFRIKSDDLYRFSSN